MNRPVAEALEAAAHRGQWGAVRMALVVVALAFVGCGADDEMGAYGYDSDGGVGPGGGGGGAGGGAGGAGGGGPPPEAEVNTLAFTPPAAGERHVWLASPANNLVVRVHAQTRAVSTIEAGDEPTLVRTRAGQDVAVALNRGSDELTLITLEEVGGRLVDRVQFVPLPGHFNQLDLDPSGAFALVWFDVADARPGERSADQQSLVVYDLEEGALAQVTIGFRPQGVLFRGDDAIVITDDGLSIVRLTGLPEYSVAPLVPLVSDPLARQGREVQVTPDGRYAVSRGPSEAGVTVVTLPDGAPREISLPGVPTDVDLLPDGERALVMLRESRQVAVVELGEWAEPEMGNDEAAEGQVVFIEAERYALGAAAVGDTGATAVLYTTVSPAEVGTTIGLLDLDEYTIEYRLVRKSIDGVAIDPRGEVAFLRHRRASGPPPAGSTEDMMLAHSDGYTLLDLRTGFTRLVTTEAQPRGLLFDPGTRDAFVLMGEPAGGPAQVQRLDLGGLAVRSWSLGSPPESVGLLASVRRAFVTQTHPSGRISFIDLERPEAPLQTVSGYTLNSRID